MKKFFLQNLMLLLCGFAWHVSAQTTPRKPVLTGDTCIGTTLTGAYPFGAIMELKWYKDNQMIEARGRYESTGSVVAKGTPETPNLLYDLGGITMYKGYLYMVQGQSVRKWLPGAATGTIVAGGNGKGSALNQFYSPVGVVVDKNGDLYISDYLTNSVRKWHPGAAAGTIAAGGNGYGAAANQFANPGPICMDRFGNIYISDHWNARVQKWAPGATSGVTVAGGNGKGSGANQLYEPSGVGVDYAGNIYVSDPYNYRVQKWAPGATTGVTVAGGNGQGLNANQLTGPAELSIDSIGTVYVMDGGKRVQRWDPGATYGVTVAGGSYYPAGTPEDSKVKFSRGLYVDPNKQVYIADIFDDRIRRFKIASPVNSVISNAAPGTYQFAITASNNQVYTSDPLRVSAIPAYPIIASPIETTRLAIIKFRVANNLPGAKYTWTVPPDATIISGQNTYWVTVKWGYNSGNITVTGSNSCGTSPVRVRYMTVPCGPENTPPDPSAINGPNPIAKQATASYEVANPAPGVDYNWVTPPNVNIVSGQGTYKLNVIWGNDSGNLSVTGSNSCATSQTRTLFVSIATPPKTLSNDKDAIATIYPNPTASNASIAFTSPKITAYELTVTNMSGKPLIKQKGTANAGKNTTDLNISNFNRGVYLVNIKYADNSTQVLKINKQ